MKRADWLVERASGGLRDIYLGEKAGLDRSIEGRGAEEAGKALTKHLGDLMRSSLSLPEIEVEALDRLMSRGNGQTDLIERTAWLRALIRSGAGIMTVKFLHSIAVSVLEAERQGRDELLDIPVLAPVGGRTAGLRAGSKTQKSVTAQGDDDAFEPQVGDMFLPDDIF